MKRSIWDGISLLIIGALLIGCGPASVSTGFAGTWTANIGTVSFVQKDNEITGVIQGYGGFWNETFTGTLNENGEAVFSTEWFGDFTLVLEGEDSFRSNSTELAFCGVRGENMELPAGCGFSGKWIVPSKSVFLPGSYMILTQVAGDVTGSLYNEKDNEYDTFTGVMEWGKGWRANGKTDQWNELSLWMNASETGFEFMTGNLGNRQELCAVREGLQSAYLSSFTCEP